MLENKLIKNTCIKNYRVLRLLLTVSVISCACIFSHGALARGQDNPLGRAEPGTPLAGDVINFGVEYLESEAVMNQAFVPLLNYMGEKLGKQFVINYFLEDKDILTHLVNGRIQVAHFSSQSYARALMTHESDVHYIATVSNSGDDPSDFYYGYIFTRKDNPAQNLRDLKGYSFGFVNRTSGSGYYYPLMLCLKAGIDPQTFFSRILFLGEHPDVTQWVINGKADAGATYDGNFRNAMQQCGNCLKIIEKTPPIPNEPWVAGKGVSREMINKIQQILLSISSDSCSADGTPAINPGLRQQLEIDSFTVHDPSFYQVVVDMLHYTENMSREN